MPLYSIVLINPIGRFTGTGKMTLEMEAKHSSIAAYEALKYAREKLYWCYHVRGISAPADVTSAQAELRVMRETVGLPPLDPEPELGALPDGVSYP